MTAGRLVWYAAYGSNLLPERFGVYLTGSPTDGRFGGHRPAPDPRPARESRRSTIAHPTYFAGHSVRWGAAVAFVELDPVPGVEFPCRLYLVSEGQLLHVVGAENGASTTPIVALDGIDVGAWVRVPVEPDGDSSRGKYTALLRLPDVEGRPVWTVTTARSLPRGEPAPDYLRTIRQGLASLGVAGPQAEDVVAAALARSTSSGRWDAHEEELRCRGC